MNTENLRFSELAPWYVNGSLNAADQAWMDAYVRNHAAEAQTELSAWGSLQTQAKQSVAPASADIGLAKALARIHAQKALRKSANPQPSALQRFSNWLFAGSNGGLAKFSPALGMALAVIAVQAVVIGKGVVSGPDYTQVRGAKKGLADGPLLRVNIKSDAKENQIRLLLIDSGALIIAGPTHLGDYYIKVAAERVEQTRSRFQTSEVVDAVSVVASLPEELVDQ
ncbi:MAG: hypothetical protein RL020_1060 [Pseudomonadota bacterium]